MSSAHPTGDQSEREASERAGQRLTMVLFGGLIAAAVIAITLSVIAGSMIHHHRGTAATNSSLTAGTVQRISLYVAPSWKPGPGGERHDAFSQTRFRVKVGHPVELTIDNRDDAVHSITSGAAGVNIVVMPGVHTYTLIVRQAGRFKWVCAYPCDPFSMAHTGYMQGYITAT